VPATVLTTLFFVWIVTEGIRIQFSNNITGKESMVGRKGEIIEPIKDGKGRIFVNGEYWNAVSDEEIKEGEVCEIVEIEGLTAKVKRST
jgi:membrane-bound serine protease (ClpP class)